MMRSILEEDTGFFDITTEGLGICEFQGKMEFFAKGEMILCGMEYVEEMFRNLRLEFTCHAKDGEKVAPNTLLCEAIGSAGALHKAWKVAQNMLEYLSAIATATHSLVQHAKEGNPEIVVATTRKNFPNTKEMMLKAVAAGGGIHHRLGLYDSILVFAQHRSFFDTKEGFEDGFAKLKKKYLEKKVVVEVESVEEASYFAALGADVLQCEKMDYAQLRECVALKKNYPALLVSATGGINIHNAEEYAACGVDFLVTSAPYHAKPLDVKVKISKL
jgi:molybdenum transport protein